MRTVKTYLALGLVCGLLSSCGWVEVPSETNEKRSYGRPAVTEKSKTATPVARTLREIPGTIIVEKGDTVYAIARKTGASVREIIETNDLRAPFHLRVGQRLKLPQDPVHEVVKGDTLYSVSRAYSTDVYSLAKTNNLSAPFTLTPGQRLKVPNASYLKPASSRLVAPSKTTTSAKATYQPTPKPVQIAKKAIPKPPARSSSRFSWPIQGKVLSSFGVKKDGLHNDGINIAAKRGSPIKAAENGVVAYSGNELRGYGNMVLVKHSGGWITAYAHAEKLLVERGQKIKRGQTIAYVGSSGGVTTPQLHFEVRKGMNPVNPKKYLGS